MNEEPQLIFFEGEDEETLKSEFVKLCAKHKNTFTAFEVATHVFSKLRDPFARAMQAAQIWGKDLDIAERIRQAILNADDDTIADKASLIRRFMAIADNEHASFKDRNDALTRIAQMQSLLPKQVELKTPAVGRPSGLAVFQFAVDPDADKSPERTSDDD